MLQSKPNVHIYIMDGRERRLDSFYMAVSLPYLPLGVWQKCSWLVCVMLIITNVLDSIIDIAYDERDV